MLKPASALQRGKGSCLPFELAIFPEDLGREELSTVE
ncbi:hypothetical protein CYA_1781 [Synechococcus sp. JA-3-3Ab]|nr:hypothetical protein CYA_1781 [Synechococcus sp. JA-3-3Ab]